MPASTLRALRFLRTWLSAPLEAASGHVEAREVELGPAETGSGSGKESGETYRGEAEGAIGERTGTGEGRPDRVEKSVRRFSATVYLPPGSSAGEETPTDASEPWAPDGDPFRGLRTRSGRWRPAWVVLHGVTRPGRRHPQLVRFCRALASAGGVAVVPEIREWVELRLAPEHTVPAVRGALDFLRGPADGAAGLVGFSFGAPQALRAAAHPSLRDRIGGVAGFGGYYDIHQAVRFQLTGRYGWQGEEHILNPDPYARWIMAANHLTDVPGCEDAGDVARALRRLAAIAGDARIPSDSAEMEKHRLSLRDEVSAPRQALFDLLAEGPRLIDAPEAGGKRRSRDRIRTGDGDRVARLEALADALSDAALETTPLLDIRPHLHDIRCPVELVHGRFDRLIPYTESLRLAEALRDGTPVHLTVTELFSHTEGRSLGAGLRATQEGWRFFTALRRVLGMV